MTAFPVDELLTPLADGAPCGPDLEYDPAFMALDEAARGRPEQQFGDTVIPAQEPDWRAVSEQALALARRTRDLRLAVLLTRSGARLNGIGGYASGLELVAGLLDRHWAGVYPLLDADDRDDPTMRLNALAPLADPAAGLADLRAAVIGSGRAAVTVRQVELAFGRAEPQSGENAPTTQGMLQALADAEAASPGSTRVLQDVHARLQRIETAVTERVGGATGPDLRPLRIVTQCLAQAATQALAGGAAAAEAAGNADAGGLDGAGATTAVATPGSIRSREDVVRMLDRVCEWVERHEPTNPAPLLIRRAQRLMNKNFLEIIRDLAPDGIDQVERIAGPAD